MRGHFRHLHFKTFPMTSRTPQGKVLCPFFSNSKDSGVPEDSKSPTFILTLGQSGVATSFIVDLLDLLLLCNQESGRLARNGQPGVSRVISSAKSRVKALHIDLSFVEPNAWNTDTGNYRRHNPHLAMDDQSQRCSLIPAT
jgi:hypothetical protein